MTTAEVSQVSVFTLGKERFDLLIGERRMHRLQPLVLDGSVRLEWWMRALPVAGSNVLSG